MLKFEELLVHVEQLDECCWRRRLRDWRGMSTR